MGVTYDVALKNARMTATRDHCANGTLEILNAADAVLATFGLDADGGTVTDDIWTLVFDADVVAASGAGTAAKAQIKTSGGTVRVTGLTVGLAESGEDIELNNTSIASGQDVELTSASIQHAA